MNNFLIESYGTQVFIHGLRLINFFCSPYAAGHRIFFFCLPLRFRDVALREWVFLEKDLTTQTKASSFSPVWQLKPSTFLSRWATPPKEKNQFIHESFTFSVLCFCFLSIILIFLQTQLNNFYSSIYNKNFLEEGRFSDSTRLD